MTLLGHTRAMVENHMGILEFTSGVIRLKTRRGTLVFEGSDLTLTEVRPGALSIRGSIGRIVLAGGKEQEDA